MYVLPSRRRLPVGRSHTVASRRAAAVRLPSRQQSYIILLLFDRVHNNTPLYTHAHTFILLRTRAGRTPDHGDEEPLLSARLREVCRSFRPPAVDTRLPLYTVCRTPRTHEPACSSVFSSVLWSTRKHFSQRPESPV